MRRYCTAGSAVNDLNIQNQLLSALKNAGRIEYAPRRSYNMI